MKIYRTALGPNVNTPTNKSVPPPQNAPQNLSLSNYFKGLGLNPIVNGNTITVNNVNFAVNPQTKVIMVNNKYPIQFAQFNVPNVQDWIKQIVGVKQPTQQNQNQQNQGNLSKIEKLYLSSLQNSLKTGRLTKQETVDGYTKQVMNHQVAPFDMYWEILSGIYAGLRSVANDIYTPMLKAGKMPHDNNIDKVTSASTPYIEVRDEGGWNYRLPKNRNAMGWSTSNKSIDRISIEAIADPKLIESLDWFVCNFKCYYKTPQGSADWLARHDPITIYFIEPINDKMKGYLSQITANYNRTKYTGKKDNLKGKSIGDGLSQEASPQTQELKDLIQQASAIDGEAGRCVDMYFKDTTKGLGAESKSSAGGVAAVKELIRLIK